MHSPLNAISSERSTESACLAEKLHPKVKRIRGYYAATTSPNGLFGFAGNGIGNCSRPRTSGQDAPGKRTILGHLENLLSWFYDRRRYRRGSWNHNHPGPCSPNTAQQSGFLVDCCGFHSCNGYTRCVLGDYAACESVLGLPTEIVEYCSAILFR